MMFQLVMKPITSYLLIALVTQTGCRLVRSSNGFGGNSIEQPEIESSSGGEQEAKISMDSMAPLAKASIECEPIYAVSLCSNMDYKSTRMPNFFNDSSQIEAEDRAIQFQLSELVNSNCSKHIQAYICELLTPVCLEKDMSDAMRRFDIYPCRSYCRLIRRDCDREIFKLIQKLRLKKILTSSLQGFDCDLLPYESNPGKNVTPEGPCIDISDQEASSSSFSTQQSQSRTDRRDQNSSSSRSDSYHKFENSNFPPFITDTSAIDTSPIIKSIVHPGRSNQHSSSGKIIIQQQDNQQQQQDKSIKTPHQLNFATQLNLTIQNTVAFIVKYSSVLCLLCVILLLIALNSRRLGLHKLKLCHFGLGRSYSSTSSENSHRQLHTGGGGGGKQQLQPTTAYQHHQESAHHHHHHTISPSSSSRSLMLFAGNNKQPPSHQLVPSQMLDRCESPKKLLDGLSRRTLVNVNGGGTIERHQNSNNNRYLIMQPSPRQQHNKGSFAQHLHQQIPQHSDKQQLFDTLDSQSSSNQYDYIEIPGDQTRSSATTSSNQRQLARNHPHQQQLFSNILLSSPSRQVFLYGSPTQQQQQQQQQSNRPPPLPPAQTRPHHQVYNPYLGANLSPYATPGISAGCGGGYNASSASLIEGGDHQRSFQRRTRKNSASSWQHRGVGKAGVGINTEMGLAGAAYTSASSSGSSDASSSPSSSGQTSAGLAHATTASIRR